MGSSGAALLIQGEATVATTPHVLDADTNYLEQYEAAEAGKKFALVRHWIEHEPIGFFRELREKRPVFVALPCTLVSRLDDVIDVLSQPISATWGLPYQNHFGTAEEARQRSRRFNATAVGDG
jgi:hypothetical protein